MLKGKVAAAVPGWVGLVTRSELDGGPAVASEWRASRRRGFYPVETVTISGAPREYVRAAESGGKVRFYFCPDCGSTAFWEADNLPAMIAVAVGAIADTNFAAPIKAVFEQSKHAWVEINGAGVEHLQQGSARKNAG